MGAVPAAEAYRGSEQGVMWMQPHLTDDVESRAGMVVVFSQHNQIIFGFEKNHMILTVTNNDGAILGGFVISPNYHSLGHDLNGMQLRVVRQRNKYYFQAKRSNPAGGCLLAVLSALGLYGGTLPGVWDGVENPGPIKFNTDFRDWKTVAIVQRTSAPVAVGMTVNKWRHPHLCDAAFYRLELKQDAKEWSIETDSMPVPMTRGDYASLQDGTAFREDTDGAIFRVTGPQLHIIAPFSRVVNGVLDHLPDHTFHHGRDADGNLIDNSPKVLTRAPTGDFAFATHAKIHRTIVTPWAGGYANLKTMFGKTTAVPATAVQVPPVIKGRQDVPPGNAYRMAFIIVVPDEASATLEALQRLDTLRRFWEVAFSFATKGQRLADTAL
jgi:hypothetical protein